MVMTAWRLEVGGDQQRCKARVSKQVEKSKAQKTGAVGDREGEFKASKRGPGRICTMQQQRVDAVAMKQSWWSQWTGWVHWHVSSCCETRQNG